MSSNKNKDPNPNSGCGDYKINFSKSDLINIKLQGIGIGERAERLLVIAVIGIFGFMDYAVVIVVIIAGITLIQRMIYTAKNIREE